MLVQTFTVVEPVMPPLLLELLLALGVLLLLQAARPMADAAMAAPTANSRPRLMW
jgi:hypothetical protein